jgi:hypothetical protein
MVDSSGIAQLVADTRFLDEGELVGFVSALVMVIQGTGNTSQAYCSNRDEDMPTPHVTASPNQVKLLKLGKVVDGILTALPSLSSSSVSWLEMLLVETALRNRDRFALLWPILSSHYRSCFGSERELSYPLERYRRPLQES